MDQIRGLIDLFKKFYKDKNLIFDLESSNTCFEYVSK